MRFTRPFLLMRPFFLCAAILLIGVLTANATPTNLVADGNFASDTVGSVFNGPLSNGSPWTVTSVGAAFGVYVVTLPGDLGPIDPLTVGGADPGGGQSADFGTDNGINTLSQSLSGFTAGDTYEVSFDAYLAFTGSRNPATPNFSVALGETQLANFALTSLPTPSSASDPSGWTHFSESFTAASSGPLTLDFTFAPTAGVGKDILLDRVFVGNPIASVTPSAVPEPATLWYVGTGALALANAVRRRFLKA